MVPGWELRSLINSLGKGKTMIIIAVGIDLAEHVFAVHGVDQAGRAARVRSSVARNKLVELIPPAAVPDMYACSFEKIGGGSSRTTLSLVTLISRPASSICTSAGWAAGRRRGKGPGANGTRSPVRNRMPCKAHEMALSGQTIPGGAWLLAPGAACTRKFSAVRRHAQGNDRPGCMP